jgi:predicted transcriptional regulator
MGQSIGVYLDDDRIDDLDDLAAKRDAQTRYNASRSEAAADCIDFGLECVELLDEHCADMPDRQQRHLVRQALLEYLRDEGLMDDA